MKQSVTTHEKMAKENCDVCACVVCFLFLSLSPCLSFSFYFMQILPNLIPASKSVRNKMQLQNCYYIAKEYKV